MSPPPSRLSAMDLEVIHRDEAILVVNKPSGLLVHRGWGRDDVTLVDLVRRLTRTDTVHPCHRLDRATSGAILFALDQDEARRLGSLFDAGQVEKRYLALVRGRPPDQGLIDHPLPRRPDGPRVEASTAFRRLATSQTLPREVSLVEVSPLTGRLHQVRRHLKHIDHPVMGDANYGKGPLNRAFRERYGLRRLALHASSFSLPSPHDEGRVTFVAPLPDDLRQPLERMGFASPDALVHQRPEVSAT